MRQHWIILIFLHHSSQRQCQDFDTRWDEVLLSMSTIPSDDILEGLYKLRIRESAQLRSVLELCDMEIHQKISMPNYQNLKTMVKRSTDQKLRLRNFDARHGRIEPGAVVENRKGLIGVKGGKGFCYQWKEKGQCSKGNQCSFRHESNDHAKPTPKAASSSEPRTPRGRSALRKGSVRGRSQSGKSQRQLCKKFLTDAVSVTKTKIVHKNQNTLPPRLLSQPCHEVEAKVTMGPFFENRADII